MRFLRQSCVISGCVSNKRAEDNEDRSPRILKEEEAGGGSSKVRDKRSLSKSKPTFDASKGTERNGRRSYSSSSQAQPSGIAFHLFICTHNT